jgi:Domain of unknown function (DUF3854)/Origin of replication binding protein
MTSKLALEAGVLRISPPVLTLESFRAQIEHEFIHDSAIAPELFADTIDFLTDLEIGISGDILSTPIHDALNWKFTRFGLQVRPNLFAAIFRNEDGSVWQAKLSIPRRDQKLEIQKYENPVGNGSRAYLPPVAQFARDAIAQRYGVDVPPVGESFWDWLEAHPEIEIIYTEGGKKALALLSQGFVAISLYGINGGYRAKDDLDNPCKPYLIPDVLRFAVPGRRIVLAFDQDTKEKTRIKVAKAIFKFSRLLEQSGCFVRVAVWNKLQGKGVDDLIAIAGLEAWELAYLSAVTLKEKQLWDRLDNRLSIAPNISLSTQDLSTLHISDLPEEGIIAIASPKGTGKTKFIGQQVKDTERAILASHRVALARHLCERLDMDYRGDLDKVKGGDFIAGGSYTFRIGSCIDSLLAFDPEKFRGCDLIVDEVCQVLRHLLTSSTCNKEGKRPALLARFRDLVQSARRIIVADADLDDQTLHYLKELRQESEIFLIRNDHAAQGYPALFLEAPDRTSICEKLIQDIQSQEPGQVIYVATDSRTTSKTVFGLIAQIYPDKRSLLINADTSGGEDERAFISNPDKVLEANDYDIVICSPSVATGTSIEVQDIVTKVYGIFQGVSGTDADIAQSLARVRQPVDRVIWCAPTGRNFCPISRSTNSLELKGHLFERTSVTTSLIRSSLKADTVSAINTIDWQCDPNIQLFAQLGAAQNFAMQNLRNALYVRLLHEGNQITLERSPSNSSLRILLQTSRETIKMADAVNILNADDLTSTEIFTLEQKETTSPEEQRAIAKFHLKEFYCLDSLTLQDILADREGRTRGELLNLEAQLYEGIGLDRTVKALEKQASWIKHICPWDIQHTEMRRELRDRLGITDFLRRAIDGMQWVKSDLETLAKQIRGYANVVKTHLGFTITDKMSDVQVVHQLLSQLGIKVDFHWSKFHPQHFGRKIRIYSLNRQHWDFYQGILSRRASKRAEFQATEGSPTALNNKKTEGDLLEKPVEPPIFRVSEEPFQPQIVPDQDFGPLFLRSDQIREA